MANNWLVSNSKVLGAGAGVLASLATVVGLFLNSQNESDVSVIGNDGSSVITVGSGAKLDNVKVEISGESVKQKAETAMQNAYISCKSERDSLRKIDGSLLKSSLVMGPVGQITPMQYELIKGEGSFSIVVDYLNWQVKNSKSAIPSTKNTEKISNSTDKSEVEFELRDMEIPIRAGKKTLGQDFEFDYNTPKPNNYRDLPSYNRERFHAIHSKFCEMFSISST